MAKKDKAPVGEKPEHDLIIVVEGEGERKAAPELVNKLRDLGKKPTVKVFAWPHRGPMGRGRIVGQSSEAKARKGVLTTNAPPLEKLLAEAFTENNGKVPVIVLLDAEGRRTDESFENERKRMTTVVAQLGKKLRVPIRLVYAIKMYESWLVAVVEKLAGYPGLKPDLKCVWDTEINPANPKDWFIEQLNGKYNERTHMYEFTRLADWTIARCRDIDKAPRNKSLVDMYKAVNSDA